MSERLTANMIRLYCDGELEPERARAVEQQLAADDRQRRRVDFERRMRDRVAAMLRSECPAAPPELAERIRRRLRQPSAEAPEAPPQEARPDRFPLADWLRGPRKANMFAVAASLALIAGAVLFGIFGPTLNSLEGRKMTDLVADAAPFVAREHMRCAGSADDRAAKARFTDVAVVREHLSRRLGSPVPAERICGGLERAGWSFVGGGFCHVPVEGPSGHLIFTREDLPRGPVMLSVFVAPYDDRFCIGGPGPETPLLPGVWHAVESGLPREVWIACDGTLTYFLVACDPTTLSGAASAVRAAVRTGGVDSS